MNQLPSLGLSELVIILVMIGFPIVTLFDLGRKKLTSIPLAIWALMICIVPVIGSLAYWITKPSAETK